MQTSKNSKPLRVITVNPDAMLYNIKTGVMKRAKQLTEAERMAEEWQMLNRKQRRQMNK